MLYRVRWDRLEQFEVQHETPKTVKVKEVASIYGGSYTSTIRRGVIGTEYHESVGAAWEAEVSRLTSQIEEAKRRLQRLRGSLGTAQSEAKK